MKILAFFILSSIWLSAGEISISKSKEKKPLGISKSTREDLRG